MRSPRLPIALPIAALALAACASTSYGTSYRPASRSAVAAREDTRGSVLSERALRRDDARPLVDLLHERWPGLVDLLHERWPGLVDGALPRGASLRLAPMADAGVVDRFGVYDERGHFVGGPDQLATVRAGDVREVRRLSAVEERVAFGRSHPGGAVVLTWAVAR